MKDLGEASYVLGIEIHRDRSRGTFGLSQKAYFERVLKKLNMHKFGTFQCPRNQYETDQMKSVPYTSVVGSIMYAQVCTCLELCFVTGMLGRYQSNPGPDQWKAAKKVLRYMQGTKVFMLTYKRTDNLEIVGYSDSDFTGCVDSKISTSGYIFTLAGGAISWKSSKQTLTARSTMQAE
jgi:hypothetical protein